MNQEPERSLMACNATSGDPLVEQLASPGAWRHKAERLWALLDDVSTAGDMFKPELTSYVRYVDGKAEERSKYLESDGSRILNVIPEDIPPMGASPLALITATIYQDPALTREAARALDILIKIEYKRLRTDQGMPPTPEEYSGCQSW